jgi:hypothetical protein
MLKILLFFISLPALAAPRGLQPPSGFQDNFWQQVQIQNLQTQQQLQSQDQYRRLLLLQDQEREIQRIQDQQNQLEYLQGSSQMHQYSDRLKMYSRPVRGNVGVVKKKPGK